MYDIFEFPSIRIRVCRCDGIGHFCVGVSVLEEKSIGISVLDMRCGMVAVTVKWIFRFFQSVLAVIRKKSLGISVLATLVRPH